LLERFLLLEWKNLRAQITETDQNRLPNSQSKQGIERLEWVEKEFVIVINSRQARAQQELIA
jgi:hypothetical protein